MNGVQNHFNGAAASAGADPMGGVEGAEAGLRIEIGNLTFRATAEQLLQELLVPVLRSSCGVDATNIWSITREGQSRSDTAQIIVPISLGERLIRAIRGTASRFAFRGALTARALPSSVPTNLEMRVTRRWHFEDASAMCTEDQVQCARTVSFCELDHTAPPFSPLLVPDNFPAPPSLMPRLPLTPPTSSSSFRGSRRAACATRFGERSYYMNIKC